MALPRHRRATSQLYRFAGQAYQALELLGPERAAAVELPPAGGGLHLVPVERLGLLLPGDKLPRRATDGGALRRAGERVGQRDTGNPLPGEALTQPAGKG